MDRTGWHGIASHVILRCMVRARLNETFSTFYDVREYEIEWDGWLRHRDVMGLRIVERLQLNEPSPPGHIYIMSTVPPRQLLQHKKISLCTVHGR